MAFSDISKKWFAGDHPVNAVASSATISAADLAIMTDGDKVIFGGCEFVKDATPTAVEWDDVDALATLLTNVPGWDAETDKGAVVITHSIRGGLGDGVIATVEVLEGTTAGGDGAGVKATATISVATIAQLKIGDIIKFAGATFTKASATTVLKNEFKDQVGLISCINAMDDWVAVDNNGAIDITADTDSVDFNDIKIIINLYRVTSGGVYGTVCQDINVIVQDTTDNQLYVNILPNSKHDANWRKLNLVTF